MNDIVGANMKSITLNIPGFDYQYSVHIGQTIFKKQLAQVLVNYEENNLFFVTSSTINALYPNFISDYIPGKLKCHTLILPDGEQYKNTESIMRIYDFLVKYAANRKSILITFGGGVIGDMGGFATATFMRGMLYIQVPTTLLSQVDSSVGGKTGVNHTGGKNLIGSFKQPLITIIDIDFLKTLPRREFIAGYAELIKHAFIRNRDLFDTLNDVSIQELSSNQTLLEDTIHQSCSVKANIVQQDEKEGGIRAILNFGHTIGHFIETFTNYTGYLHGEAIIVGMDFAAWWSMKQKMLSNQEYQLIHSHLSNLNIKVQLSELCENEFITIIDHDKKVSSAGVRFVGLNRIGQASIIDNVQPKDLWNKFKQYVSSEYSLVEYPISKKNDIE